MQIVTEFAHELVWHPAHLIKEGDALIKYGYYLLLNFPIIYC